MTEGRAPDSVWDFMGANVMLRRRRSTAPPQCVLPTDQTYGLIKCNKECESGDTPLGSGRVSLNACATLCEQHAQCRYFVHGKPGSDDVGSCYYEHTTDACRSAGFESDNKYDFYMVRASSDPNYVLIEADKECRSSDTRLGTVGVSLTECANLCENHEDCRYFVYGKSSSSAAGYCYYERTTDACHAEGFENDNKYDFYMALPAA